MSNPNVEIREFIHRLNQYSARLNPGLSAVALALSMLVAAEAASHLPSLQARLYDALHAANAQSSDPDLTGDPTAPLSAYHPLSLY